MPLSNYFHFPSNGFFFLVAFCSTFFFFFYFSSLYFTFFSLPMVNSFVLRFFSILPFTMLFCSFRGCGRNSVRKNTHFSAVKAQCSVNILWESLHYRMIKLLIKLLLIASLIRLTMAVQLTDNIKNKPI